ncbi:hypothetical protein LI033_01025 [bacterium TM223]|uniref:hypothetical protein n=1 Tax=Faecalibacillus intestinalis TaxID=1982626 RepID=UPI00210B02C3|nr:hypothetical protein [Faecalibacillus intestinalis]MCB7553108.1 hypothetical protein [bacterium TM223]MCQ4766093.1 hypothetical protein [Faecalibacillus intestinalis]
MTTFVKIKKVIAVKKDREILNDAAKETLKDQMDTFLLNGRISEEEYNLLMKMLEGEE